MRTWSNVFALLVLSFVAGAAEARAYDAKALARYDTSFVECEALYPDMKGHRDQAYLDLWRIPADERSLGRLRKLRSDPAYLSEKQRAGKAAASPASAAASGVVQRQCRGLWAEHQRAAAQKRP